MPLFGRKVLVQLGGVDIGESFEDLRVRFNITKTLKSEPNSGNIEIYGLTRTSVAAYISLERDLRVRLLAGYDTPYLLFDGNPVKESDGNSGISFRAEGAERVFKIKAKDGLRRYERARVNVSLGQETSLEDVLVKVAEELAVPVDTIDVPPDIQLTQGVSLTGQATDVLDRLALSTGADWSIQDGKFQFLARRSARRGQGLLLSTEARNIIGSPQRKGKGVKVTTFIHGSVVPGAKFRLRSDEGLLDGDYKATEVKYTGDSHYGDDFHATITGVPYKTQAEGEAEAAAARAALRKKIERQVKRGRVDKDTMETFWDIKTPPESTE